MFGKSNWLCVRVMEGPKQIVAVKLPSIAIGWIEKLMPTHVLARLDENQIDLADIRRQAKESNMVPQDLFALDSGERTYRVWLE